MLKRLEQEIIEARDPVHRPSAFQDGWNAALAYVLELLEALERDQRKGKD